MSAYYKYNITSIHNIIYDLRETFAIFHDIILYINKELVHLNILHFMRLSGFDTCKTFTAIPVLENCGGRVDGRPSHLLLWTANAYNTNSCIINKYIYI